MTAPAAAPVLSTPDAHVFQEALPTEPATAFRHLSQSALVQVYEVDRTAKEILDGGWCRIALQFPDDMLNDAPRVFDLLSERLTRYTRSEQDAAPCASAADTDESLARLSINDPGEVRQGHVLTFKLTILADTSYGACCVDEIAAEHVDADVVVHYGRTCLSPTARLPVIYVYTVKPIDIEHLVDAFQRTYPDRTSKVVLLADIPYQGHIGAFEDKLRSVGYSNLFAPSVIHDPASLIPNRALPLEAANDPEALKSYSVFHLSEPPQSLLLNLSSRVSSVFIYSTTNSTGHHPEAIESSTAQTLRRRYALVTNLSSVPIFGILINTLSVKNYMSVLQRVKDMISAAGKKYYTFVVGKVNAAKIANFSEVGGWVVIGCWESSLIESKDFWKPIITPFELKLALTDERDRLWTGEWNSNFQALLDATPTADKETTRDITDGADNAEEQSEDESEPPVFDLRTGRYVSQSRPMARPARAADAGKTSTSLVKRANGDLAKIGGEVSPAAEFLRSQRTWQGLGSDNTIEYQFDDEGRIQGAQMEEGRSGIARGYAVGEDSSKS